jgi:hypothetical protein
MYTCLLACTPLFPSMPFFIIIIIFSFYFSRVPAPLFPSNAAFIVEVFFSKIFKKHF